MNKGTRSVGGIHAMTTVVPHSPTPPITPVKPPRLSTVDQQMEAAFEKKERRSAKKERKKPKTPNAKRVGLAIAEGTPPPSPVAELQPLGGGETAEEMRELISALQGKLVKEQKKRVKAEEKERQLQNKVNKEKEHAAASKNNLILLMESEETNEMKIEQTEAAKAEADARCAALRRTELQKVLVRMQKRALLASFESWCGVLQEKRQLQRAAARVLAMLTKGCLVRAWSAWLSDHTRQKKATRIMLRMSSLHMVGLFSTWVAKVEVHSAPHASTTPAHPKLRLVSANSAQNPAVCTAIYQLNLRPVH